jgi:hypothetical protein
MGNTCLSSRKYLSTVIPRCVTAKTTRRLPIVRSSTSPCFMRKSRYSLRTLQLTFALYIMCVSLRGPLCASTLRMSTYISSLLRLIDCPFPQCFLAFHI